VQNRLFETIERFGDDIALIDPAGARLSYRALVQRADDAVAALGGQRSLILCEMTNEIEPVAFYVGALRAGHVVIPVSGPADDIAAAFAPKARFVRTGAGWTLQQTGQDAALHPDLAVLLSTSGSTGSPKLVRLSHANLVSNAAAIAEYLAFEPGERAITSLPPHYSYGLSVLHSHLQFGHAVVLSSHSVIDEAFWDTVRRENVTSFAGVPHTFELLSRTDYLNRDYPSLRYFTQAGGKLPADKVRRIAIEARAAGRRFYVMYGQTEAAPRMAYLPPQDAIEHAGTIGRAIPGGELAIDPLGEADAMGNPQGELVYRGPNVMMGYACAPPDLAGPQGSDELRTGDVAVREPGGYFRIVGRMSRFAKLFGLRLSYDDIERRLGAAGTSAAVTGDDSGIAVAVLAPAVAADVAAALARDLDIPASLITVVAVDELPRLPTGKIDYQAVRARAKAVADAAEQQPPPDAGLAATVASIFGRSEIDASESFSTLGGDSLTYVQACFAIEDHLGYLPPDWESLSIASIERLPRRDSSAASAENRVSIIGYDVARSVAILLSLLAHSLVRTNGPLGPVANLIVRLATPTLIILFGVMIALLHVSRMRSDGSAKALQNNLKMSLQCYGLFALNVFAFWLTEPAGWKYALITLALLGSMPYAQILSFYAVMFLLLSPIVSLLRRYNFYVLLGCALAIHLAFPLFKAVPTPPEIGGQPMLQRLLDLVIGSGSHPLLAGPSLAHSLVLVLAGYWIGLAARNASSGDGGLAAFFKPQLPLLAVFAGMAVWSMFIPGYPVSFELLTDMTLRNLNHPAYIFMIGGLALLLLDVFLVSPWTRRVPGWFMIPGRRSLFAFGFGNVLIILWPASTLAALPPLWNAAILFACVFALIYAYDYCIRTGPQAGGIAGLVSRARQAGDNMTARAAHWLVQTFQRRPAGGDAEQPVPQLRE
jgi:acyl-CoA synthetase (AMP-forming)/AMP-acid ligase II